MVVLLQLAPSASGDSVSMLKLAGKQVSQLVHNPYTGKLNHFEQTGSGVYTSCAACDSLYWFMYGQILSSGMNNTS